MLATSFAERPVAETEPFMDKKISIFSYLLALAIVLSSAGGLFLPETYAQETPSWTAQGLGQDVVNLVLVVPLLGISAVGARRGSRAFFLVLGGIFLYSLYSYVLYGFCVHFNRLFFFYCGALGLSVYGLILLAVEGRARGAEKWFEKEKNMAVPALYFLFMAAIFYFLWLSEDIPAVLTGTPPKSLSETGLFTNPVHVLDLSLVLPAMVLASFRLLRRKWLGYFLFPIMMVFSILMSAAIGGMMVALSLRGIGGNPAAVTVCAAVILLDVMTLFYFFKCLNKG